MNETVERTKDEWKENRGTKKRITRGTNNRSKKYVTFFRSWMEGIRIHDENKEQANPLDSLSSVQNLQWQWELQQTVNLNVYGITLRRFAQLTFPLNFTLNKHNENWILENATEAVNCWKHVTKLFNPLNRKGYFMHHLIWRSSTPHFAHTMYLCGSNDLHNNQRIFLYTAITDFFFVAR
jgi:hypothetical protein